MTKKPSKVLIKNIYYMLAYSFNLIRETGQDEIAAEDFENIHNLFAAILERGMARQLKQGLYKEYLNKNEDLAVLRGKLDINGTIGNRLQRKQLLNCDYDELSSNIIFNRIMKIAAIRLARYESLDKDKKKNLNKLISAFQGIDEIEPSSIKWHNLHYHRNNQNYKMLLNICNLILNSLLMTEEKGTYKMASFIDEQALSSLFEKFVMAYYKKHHPLLRPRADMVAWDLDTDNKKHLPSMNTDIVLRSKGKTLIIDTKYYSSSMQTYYDKRTIHSNNLYQIYAYVKNYDKAKTGNVSGLLLYARTDEAITPNVDYKMAGNRIGARTLDLNVDFAQLKAQLDYIVSDYFEMLS